MSTAIANAGELLCPDCRAPAAVPGARLCAAHGLYLLPEGALAKLDEAPLLGQILDGKYALVDLLGGGGYGSVYRGLQQPLGREVAVKVLHGLALNLKIGRDRFEREALSLARLGSPHTVRLIDFGITRDGPIGVRNLPYMAMELIEGEDLEHRLRRGPLPPAEVLDVLEGVADSLAEAHSVGIIHRDLKPSNVLLTRTHTGRVIPKVIDFGIARIEGANKSGTGFVTGTPAYMSPEQVRGESELDLRVDVYALAAMTFELLSGRPPYTGNDPVVVLTAHCVAPIPSLRATVSDSQLWAFDTPLAIGMAKDRTQRHESVGAFVAACREAWSAQRPSAAPAAVLPSASLPAPEVAPEVIAAVASAPNTAFYSSPPGAGAAIVGGPTQVSPGVATSISHDVATAVRVPTPLTISNLPSGSLALAPSEATPPSRSRGRGLAVGLALGAVALTVWTFALLRESAPADEPTRAVVTPTAVAVGSAASSAPTSAALVASEPASPTPVSAVASAHLPIAANAAGVAATSPPKPKTRPTLASALVSGPLARQAVASPEDAPPAPESDAAARRLATEVDRDLANCRCGAAGRLLEQLGAVPRGAPLATARKANVAACRPVDIDHRCEQGRLVEVE